MHKIFKLQDAVDAYRSSLRLAAEGHVKIKLAGTHSQSFCSWRKIRSSQNDKRVREIRYNIDGWSRKYNH